MHKLFKLFINYSSVAQCDIVSMLETHTLINLISILAPGPIENELFTVKP